MSDERRATKKCRLVKRYVNIAYIGGENLRLHRERVGLSQAELAKKITDLTGFEVTQRRISERECSFEFASGPMMVGALRKILEIS